jgi:transcriptional regulator with XRE-family HTH domain
MFEVAVAAGISPETLRKIETGRVATPAFSTIAAIAAVLGLSLDDVWSAINPPAQASGREQVSDQRADRLAS